MIGFHKPIALFVFLLGTMTLQATIIRVPADKPTIQAAINSASNGDTVVVYPGLYYENINFRGKKIVVTGLFYKSGDLNFIQSTIINGSQPIHPDTSSCVLFIKGEDSTTVFQGFTVTGGKGTKWKDEHSSGTYREGGGILIAKSAPIIRYNLIINNQASNTVGVTSAGGGGIRAGDGNPKILNNVITTNQGRYGAAIVLNWCAATIRNNIITNNSGGQDYGGGALWLNQNGATVKIIENNTIISNKVIGVYFYNGGANIRNCIIWGNTSSQIGVQTGGPTVIYSDVQGGRTGVGNINQDPMLKDTSFYLQPGSPCIDEGDSAANFNDVADPLSPSNALLPSQGIIRNDMGAYGGPGAGKLLTFNSLLTEVNNINSHFPSEFRLEQNYPNPFNPSSTIDFSIPLLGTGHTVSVQLKIYDLLGREVTKLVDEEKSPGNYEVKFNASGLPSGVYFYNLRAGDFVQTRKMLLVK
jgi:hypothetical protein